MSEAAATVFIDGVRDALSGDVSDLVRLGITALEADPAPGQRISTERLQDIGRHCVLDRRSYARVFELNGRIVAALLGHVHPQMCYERNMVSVVQFYTTVPNCGIPLLRDFMTWARSQRHVKCIGFTLEAGADPRIGDMLARLGLDLQGLPLYLEWR